MKKQGSILIEGVKEGSKKKGIREGRSCRKNELGRKTEERSREGKNIGMISISY